MTVSRRFRDRRTVRNGDSVEHADHGLRPDQRDDDSLPPYEILDPILHGLVEEELSVAEIVARGFDEATVARIERLLYLAEYKRRQAPPGVKLGSRNFGRDRRYPITHRFRSG